MSGKSTGPRFYVESQAAATLTDRHFALGMFSGICLCRILFFFFSAVDDLRPGAKDSFSVGIHSWVVRCATREILRPSFLEVFREKIACHLCAGEFFRCSFPGSQS